MSSWTPVWGVWAEFAITFALVVGVFVAGVVLCVLAAILSVQERPQPMTPEPEGAAAWRHVVTWFTVAIMVATGFSIIIIGG